MWHREWRPYVSVGDRRKRAAEHSAQQRRKGVALAPVVITGRVIATSFWGRAWCERIEHHADFASRLPRGRSYVRNGSVVDLQIARGAVTATVLGSELYTTKVKLEPLAKARWTKLADRCRGGVDSVVALLQGRLPPAVLEALADPAAGLLPDPGEMQFDCSCPDWADLCKHVAAVLYGIGARLDEKPELLFELRGADVGDIVGNASAADLVAAATEPAFGDAELGDLFGIELEGPIGEPRPAAPVVEKTKARSPAKKPAAKTPVAKKPLAKTPVAKKPVAKKPLAKKPLGKTPVAKASAKRPVVMEPVATKTAAATKPAEKTPVSAKQPVAKKASRGAVIGTRTAEAKAASEAPATLTASDLRRRGVPQHAITRWLKNGVLERTGNPGLYRATNRTESEIARVTGRRS